MKRTPPTSIAALRLLCVFLTACVSGPQIRRTADYRPMALEGRRVLIGRLATSDDFVDERTGITLSTTTRSLASSGACARIAESRSDGSVACHDRGQLASSLAMAELERLFALDKPIPQSIWRSLREISVAEHAILFRPESVASSRRRETEVRDLYLPIDGDGVAIAIAQTVSALIAVAAREEVVTHSTGLTYTLSASLLDMRTGKLLKVGVHVDGRVRQVKRDLGFGEAPPAAPLLEDMMVALGEAMLEE